MLNFAQPTPTELQILREETAAELQRRYRLSAETAQRIVDISRSVDQAYAMAGLMK